MEDVGYWLYDPSEPDTKFFFDKGTRGLEDVDVENNENRTELRTFGRTPYIYYAGETDFAVFEISTVFYYDDFLNITARQQVDDLKKLIKKRKTLAVANGHGQLFKCDVQIVSERAPKIYAPEDFDYIEVTIRCTEIDD